MSGILESESDNEDSIQSSSVSSVNENLRQQRQRLSVSPGTSRDIITRGNLVQNRLEQYSRQLSMLGLDSSQDVAEQSTNVIEADDNNHGEPTQEVPLSASLQLNQVPQATNKAIEDIEKKESDKTRLQEKVQIRFQPIGSISQIYPSVCKISSMQPFSLVIQFLRKRLRVNEVFCYINNSFAPNPQLIVGNLWSQFKVDDELIISYCGTTAFG